MDMTDLHIVEMHVGSHLYGTSTSSSDVDLKGVFVPDGRDILLGRVKPVTHKQTRLGERNAPGDIDRELFALQKFRH